VADAIVVLPTTKEATMAKKKTPGTPGMGNSAYAEAMRELRRSSAASKHRNKKKYHRPSSKKEMAY
jgi:hypothetical protein